MSTSKSWGHALQRLDPEQLPVYDPFCRVARCRERATHLGTYDYVTGRAGRVSFARRFMCDEHAAKFRTKHHLPDPEVGAVPRHALDRVLDGFPAYQGADPRKPDRAHPEGLVGREVGDGA